jgi:transcriptional regulator GlxA family with amidase domain
MAINVGIYVYDEVEVLDFSGPFEVFSSASRVYRRLHPDKTPPFTVFTVCEEGNPIQARGGLIVMPAYRFKEHPALDILIVPGGVVAAEMGKERVLSWIRETSARTELTASVCTGAFLLAKAGLLEKKAATTHAEDLPALRASFPGIHVREGVRWVDAGRLVTSAGISAGIDMSLYLVSRVIDEDLAARTALQMEFDWNPEP